MGIDFLTVILDPHAAVYVHHKGKRKFGIGPGTSQTSVGSLRLCAVGFKPNALYLVPRSSAAERMHLAATRKTAE